ncbi:probable high-affinity glucose transporter [Serendipita indica DSM 11827]|uniref:Probable high-affinity glucose transporter n=1 Tax=Serendipita indica (strain DSM 11827) TaxID=1109443 RepID=G4TAD9_SERID|nr:probable high-affinity glucose transporter [Serendipita indica DSM 11827]
MPKASLDTFYLANHRLYVQYSKTILRNPYIVGSFACIGGGLFGLDISSMSGVLTAGTFHLTSSTLNKDPGPNAQGGIVASMPAGSLVGALAVGRLADILGRKKTIQLSGIIWVIGSILQCAAVNRGMLVAGRLISGSSVGIASATVPLYQAEITAAHIRGRMISLQQALVNYVGNMIPAIVLSIGMTWFPESPRWLIDHGHEDEALEILAEVHGKGNPDAELVQLEFTEIKDQVEFEKKYGAKSYKDLLEPNVLRRLTLATSLQAWSQLTGMNIMMYYITYVFIGAGLTGRRGNLIASSVQYVLNVAMTLPAIIYIDKWGRRPMLLAGLLLMGFWLFLVGGLQGMYGQWGTVDGDRVWVITGNQSITKGVIVCSYFFVCSFAITMGPCSWTYASEIHPLRVRAKAVSLATASNWIMNCVLAWAVPPALSSISYKTYYIFGGFNFAAFIHVLFMFPETCGRSLEEIEEVFSQGHVFTAWKIKRDVGKKTLQDVKGAHGMHHAEHPEPDYKGSQELQEKV